ncbi:acyl-CoA thioesterase [Paragemmobacter straminiformis]|uniref:Acyl-CoA thioesterase n=1 Tax=Paragemmobacter straminiformis TaxID=2045119 RepID=A0A842I9F8_9RHOB|nr:thioesterase family protein [Gemmobacter straminiformis]MBC2835724.1 acyl-CoA thioesterase [Gemmobacter straminiformis]
MSYSRAIRIEFNHCDPAGIVFYPRYYEMTNSVIENFFRDAIGWPFEAMMAAGEGVPTVRIETDFRAPSRLGDMLDWRLGVTRLGHASVTLRLGAACDGQTRLGALITLVRLGADHRPAPWPATIRDRLAAHQEAP